MIKTPIDNKIVYYKLFRIMLSATLNAEVLYSQGESNTVYHLLLKFCCELPYFHRMRMINNN